MAAFPTYVRMPPVDIASKSWMMSGFSSDSRSSSSSAIRSFFAPSAIAHNDSEGGVGGAGQGAQGVEVGKGSLLGLEIVSVVVVVVVVWVLREADSGKGVCKDEAKEG